MVIYYITLLIKNPDFVRTKIWIFYCNRPLVPRTFYFAISTFPELSVTRGVVLPNGFVTFILGAFVAVPATADFDAQGLHSLPQFCTHLLISLNTDSAQAGSALATSITTAIRATIYFFILLLLSY